MNLFKLAAPVALSLSMLLSAPAQAAPVDEVANFVVTPALLKKLENAEKESKLLKRDDDDEDDDSDSGEQTVEGAIKRLERDPRARALLAKHGIGSREMVLASFAMLHAGFYVMMEKSMDKQKAAQAYKGYTKAQKANIALMRTYAAKDKK